MIFTKKKSSAVSSIKQGADGKYAFSGAHYEFNGTHEEYRKLKTSLIIESVLITCLWGIGGSIPAVGMMNTFWVIIPYFICLLIAGGSAVWGAVRILYAGKKMRDYVYRATVPSVPKRAVATVICAALSIIAEAVYVIIYGFGNEVIFTIVEFALMICIAISAVALNKTVKSSNWEIKEKSLIND